MFYIVYDLLPTTVCPRNLCDICILYVSSESILKGDSVLGIPISLNPKIARMFEFMLNSAPIELDLPWWRREKSVHDLCSFLLRPLQRLMKLRLKGTLASVSMQMELSSPPLSSPPSKPHIPTTYRNALSGHIIRKICDEKLNHFCAIFRRSQPA